MGLLYSLNYNTAEKRIHSYGNGVSLPPSFNRKFPYPDMLESEVNLALDIDLYCMR